MSRVAAECCRVLQEDEQWRRETKYIYSSVLFMYLYFTFATLCFYIFVEMYFLRTHRHLISRPIITSYCISPVWIYVGGTHEKLMEMDCTVKTTGF